MSILQLRASDVRIQEINLSQVITSASSAVAGQVIVSTQGSTKPKQFTNAQDYLNEYGNPNAKVSFDVYCGLDFFREGSNLWGVRVVGAGALYSSVLMYNDNSGLTQLVGIDGIVDPENDVDWDGLVPSGGTALALFYPNKGQGSYGDNYAVSITSNNVDAPTNFAAASATSGGLLVPGNYQYQIASIGTSGETLASQPVVLVVAGSGTTYSNVLTWDPVPLAVGYRLYGRTNDNTFGMLVDLGQGTYTWTDTGAVTPDTAVQPITSPADLPTPDPIFTVNFYDLTQSQNNPVESFDCSLGQNTDDTGAATELTERINPFSQYMLVTSNVTNLITIPAVTTAAKVQLTGGDSGAAPTNYQVAAAYSQFSDKQLYDVNLLINAGRADPNVQMAMDTLASTRGDAVALLDVPSNAQQFQQAINYRNLTLNLSSNYSALFCPDVLEADNINGKQQYVPFSGWAAALCARTDRVANPSFSPAGLNRGIVNVLKTRYTYDDGQATSLFKAQVNYTRTFIGQGIALWEQQTLDAKQSALSWLSVRRIVNVIKTSLYEFLVYSLQEPNDDFTGRQIVGACSDYLETVKNARGISSYTVVSDSSNNTAAMFNSGIRRVTVIIVPVIPIHEIQLQVVISKQGVSFDEVLSTVANQ